MMKKIIFVLAVICSAFAGFYIGQFIVTEERAAAVIARMDDTGVAKKLKLSGYRFQKELPPTVSGQYLASQFAQNRHDWNEAYSHLSYVLEQDPDNFELIKRSMILATGSGKLDKAAERAKELLEQDPENSIALLILAVDSFRNDQTDQAMAHLEAMKEGDLTDFVKPLIMSWIDAAKGDFKIIGFNETAIHEFHAALIGHHLGRKEEMADYITRILSKNELSNYDAERVADLLVVMGNENQAEKFYEGLILNSGSNKIIEKKLAALKNESRPIDSLLLPAHIKNAKQGAALALYDMAYILYQEQTISSTFLFTHLALALDPALTNAHLLLADTYAHAGRFDEAIAHLSNVPVDHPSFLESQRYAAELLAEADRTPEAKERLNKLFIEHNDVESLIRIGDLHRREENYASALEVYNKAATHISNEAKEEEIPEEYWHLLYARGMAYEREGKWTDAEADLKAALVYQPNHPYLMNYLGYGWADQGVKLDRSLELVEKAASLRPRDGYIIDSLGWVKYMMGLYEQSVPHLERAVELLPYDPTINDHLGDAYWKTGRKIEARFQWERALNHAEDTALQDKIREKLKFGPIETGSGLANAEKRTLETGQTSP